MQKIIFITATRAEYGKIKSILKILEKDQNFIASIFVTGMHLQEKFGYTYREIVKDGFSNIFLDENYIAGLPMDQQFASIITSFSKFITSEQPDMIVVHGDRLEALAGAVVGAFNNILVAHIEGGEITGTIDESIRHAITKLAHLHFVANEEAKTRLLQLGEVKENIYIFGSPDIDIMLSNDLPSLEDVRQRYQIPFEKFAIVLYHPVVTEYDKTLEHVNIMLKALIDSDYQYVVVYPNNDLGHEYIVQQYQTLEQYHNKFRLLPSLRFEYFLTLLKYSEFIIGNSSAGVREACVYGVPAIDLGSRQQGRYHENILKNILPVKQYSEENIVNAITNSSHYRNPSLVFGNGKSAELFHTLLNTKDVWNTSIQKKFVDLVGK